MPHYIVHSTATTLLSGGQTYPRCMPEMLSDFSIPELVPASWTANRMDTRCRADYTMLVNDVFMRIMRVSFPVASAIGTNPGPRHLIATIAEDGCPGDYLTTFVNNSAGVGWSPTTRQYKYGSGNYTQHLRIQIDNNRGGDLTDELAAFIRPVLASLGLNPIEP